MNDLGLKETTREATMPRTEAKRKVKTNFLSESAKLANPGTPTVFETRWRCYAGRGKYRQSSIHKTQQEAELSASCCRGRWPYCNSVRVEQTLEEFFDI